jgi:periplasmic protein TonB
LNAVNAFVLHDTRDRTWVLRWGASAAAIAAIHAGLIALGLAWYAQRPPPGATMSAIMVDLAPASSAPRLTPADIAPGPQMQQADASPPPEPAKQEQEQERERIAATPPQPKPEVEAPPEHKMLPKPEAAKIIPERPKPVPVKPRPVRTEAKQPTETIPARRSSAPPHAARQAPAASAMSVGAVAAIASYNQLVAAHLQRFKQYPPDAKAAGHQGTARLSFSLGRGGQVLGSRLAGSSGHAALDGETLAMVRRAQPFPAFPPEIKQASMSFNVPVQFSIR